MDKLIKIEPKTVKIIIYIQWLFLIIYSIIKLFGGNYFEIVCENDSFINACQFIDNHLWSKIIVCSITSYVMFYFFYLAILGQKSFSKKQLMLFIILIPVESTLKLVTNQFVSLICDIIVCFVIPFIMMKLNDNKITKKWILLYFLLGNIFNLLFQIISAFTKNIGVNIMDESTLITLIYSIDMFIMLSLYYSYSNLLNNRKENK